jgi:hypothetical protein
MRIRTRAPIDDPVYEWLMIDADHCNVSPNAAGARGGNQDMGREKGKYWLITY